MCPHDIIVHLRSSWASFSGLSSFASSNRGCFHQLGLGWSYECDVFSLGCILVEFFTGIALFQTHDNLEHLAMMEAVMSKMPERFARAGARSKPEFFREGNRLDWPKPKASRQSKKDVRMTQSLRVRSAYLPAHQDDRLMTSLVVLDYHSSKGRNKHAIRRSHRAIALI